MAEQNSNPFEDFQPSWLKAEPASTPVMQDKEAEDILLQEVVAPLRATPVNGFDAPAPEVLSSPANSISTPNPYPHIAPVYPVSEPIAPPDTLPPSLEALRYVTVKPKSQKFAVFGKNSKPGLWLLAAVALIAFVVLGYAIFVASQGGERQNNSQPATDVGEMPHYPDSYMINLNPTELNPFVAKASLALSKINKQACFRSPANLVTVQQFYETRLSSKKFVPQGTVAEGVPQTDAWRDAKGSIGTALGAISVGYLDFGYFNRAEPGQTVFCLFSGQAMTQTDDTSSNPGATVTSGKAGPLPTSALNTPVPTLSNNNNNPPNRNNLPTPNNPKLSPTNNAASPIPSGPPLILPTPTTISPLDKGA